jgi:hypothetical protein
MSSLDSCDSLISLRPDDDSVPFEFDELAHKVNSAAGTVDGLEQEDLPKQVWQYCHMTTVKKPQQVRPFTGEMASGVYRPPVKETVGREKVRSVIARYSVLQKEKENRIAEEKSHPKSSKLKVALEQSVAAMRDHQFVAQKGRRTPDCLQGIEFKAADRCRRARYPEP